MKERKENCCIPNVCPTNLKIEVFIVVYGNFVFPAISCVTQWSSVGVR